MTDTIDKSAVGDVLAAEAKLRDAVSVRDHMFQRAAQGETVVIADIRLAEDATRNAEIELGLARAAEAHRRTEGEKQQIAALKADAEALEADVVKAAKAFVVAAEALDDALKVARDLADAMDAARAAFSAADHAAHRHNGAVSAVANENRTLRAMHTSVWPKAQTAGQSPQRFEAKVHVALATLGGAPLVLHESALQMAQDATHSVPGL